MCKNPEFQFPKKRLSLSSIPKGEATNLGMSVPLDFDFSLFQSPKGRLQTPHSSLESGISVQFQSPKGRLQTQKYGTVSATKKYCFNPQRGGYKPALIGLVKKMSRRVSIPKGEATNYIMN